VRTPALCQGPTNDAEQIETLATAGAASGTRDRRSRPSLCQDIIGDMTDSLCRSAGPTAGHLAAGFFMVFRLLPASNAS
jgi:hypothetical protein